MTTPLPISFSSCVSRATSSGPRTPTIPLRVAIEKSTAMLV